MKNKKALFGLMALFALTSCGGGSENKPNLSSTESTTSEKTSVNEEKDSASSSQKEFTEQLQDGNNRFASENRVLCRAKSGDVNVPAFEDFISLDMPYTTMVNVSIATSDPTIISASNFSYKTKTNTDNNILNGISLVVDRTLLKKNGEVYVEVIIQSENNTSLKATLTKKYTVMDYGQDYPEDKLYTGSVAIHFYSPAVFFTKSEVTAMILDINTEYGFNPVNATTAFILESESPANIDFKFIPGHQYSISITYKDNGKTYFYTPTDTPENIVETAGYQVKDSILEVFKTGKTISINLMTAAETISL